MKIKMRTSRTVLVKYEVIHFNRSLSCLIAKVSGGGYQTLYYHLPMYNGKSRPGRYLICVVLGPASSGRYRRCTEDVDLRHLHVDIRNALSMAL